MAYRGLIAGLLALSAAACARREPPVVVIPPVSTGKVRVRVFTEPSPVRLLASAGRFVFVATDGDLERWADDGSVLPLSAEQGLSGSQIVALAPDVDRRWVWVLTEGGLGHYDLSSEAFQQVAAPPPALAIDFAALAKEGASVAPAADGGAWLGTARGLVYVDAQGAWTPTLVKEPIRALARDQNGWLWIATKLGLIARKPNGQTVRIGGAEGCAIVDPRLLVELPDANMLVIGADESGHDRLAFGKQTAWTTYRALPDVKWDAAARRGNGAVVMAGDRVYRISPLDVTHVRPLAREGLRLVALASKKAEWMIDPVDVVVPPGAMSIASVDDQLLIGTRDLGTARYRDGDQHPRDWLRRRQMFLDATTLSVACAKETDCWIATGARQAWHWMGDRFVPGGPDQVVLAVVRDPAGPIFALHRTAGDSLVKLSRIEPNNTWLVVPKVALSAAGNEPEVSFARFAAPGQLWVGLRYRDEGEAVHSYGVAIVETATGKVTYHRTGDIAVDRKTKVMPLPEGVLDADVRGETAWFATSDGIARLAGSKLETWATGDGLRAQSPRAVTIGADGAVIVATGQGAARWDGKAWEFPAPLRFDINDVVATRNGQVWMATERGIAAWDGHKVRRVDTRRGLAENRIIDVAADQFDRVWARGPGSLTLISQ
ncbi:MAG TPA: hypothetical protein VFQ53_31285 [Kofleriaceae bacterium]|nr:hypothetical protein [Kofleriaceae bacterium]